MGWLLTILANLAGLVGIQLSKKAALATAAIAASVALTVALAGAIQTLLNTVIVSLPSDLAAAGFFVPSNAAACVSAVIGAKFARFVYDWNMKNLEIASSIN